MNHPGKMLPEVLASIWKQPATVRYPKERTEIPADFRGRIVFDAKSCIGCKMCMRDCPAKAIEIEKTGEEKVFSATFYLDRCIYCAQCVDSCPKSSLQSTSQFELANYERSKLRENQA